MIILLQKELQTTHKNTKKQDFLRRCESVACEEKQGVDNNSTAKNDVKDAKVIAQLVKDGRYAIPNIPQGIYVDLREAMKIRDHLSTDLRVVQGRVHNWIDRYFPEFLTVFKDWECKSPIQMLGLGLLPHELVSLSDEFLLGHLREAAKRGAGLGRMQSLKSAVSRSVGIKQGMDMAKMEIQLLLVQYQLIQSRLDELHTKLDKLMVQVSGVNQLLAINTGLAEIR